MIPTPCSLQTPFSSMTPRMHSSTLNAIQAKKFLVPNVQPNHNFDNWLNKLFGLLKRKQVHAPLNRELQFSNNMKALE